MRSADESVTTVWRLCLGTRGDEHAGAFANLLDGLGIRRAAVLAASGGATSAIRFAARHPERVSALVLLCPDAPPGLRVPPRFIFGIVLRSDFLYWAVITFFRTAVQRPTGLVPKRCVLTPEDDDSITNGCGINAATRHVVIWSRWRYTPRRYMPGLGIGGVPAFVRFVFSARGTAAGSLARRGLARRRVP
jgi:pimeloyl-ACP methyl ester carboxylesterase